MEPSAHRPTVGLATIELGGLVAWAAGSLLIAVHDGSVGGRLLRALIVIVAGLAALASRDRPGGQLVLIVLGVVGIDLGITFGIRFVVDAGVSLVAIAGLLVLLGGLALAVAGGHRLIAGRGRWRFVAGPLLAVVVAGAVWNTAPAVLATNVPPIERGAGSPASYGLDAVDVRFPATDGTELAGWYVPSRNGAAVVLRHGAGSTATANLAQAAVIAGHGYGVLLTMLAATA